MTSWPSTTRLAPKTAANKTIGMLRGPVASSRSIARARVSMKRVRSLRTRTERSLLETHLQILIVGRS